MTKKIHDFFAAYETIETISLQQYSPALLIAQ
eukprot:CAMPEP_0202959002 /NCGR_PEP_ID=MMETSP1396-20130829/3273_1 /ASSEMBLY_ACC=CAM_ASM_000872 /TAXON_ID= /ORGANISM="Pseudokeronopsis sp., Strain Brazil" /LENGTH=31 /DNA_ID= /DNA_START= /DNA_END= /DNA_ORIENTATION=